MNSKELVFELMKKNNGVLEAKQARLHGINNKTLQRLTNYGEIERVGHGIYIDSNYMEDEYLIAQYRCKKGIFSHETALFFHELIDRTPFQLTLTIPSGYNTRILKDNSKYKFFYIKKHIHNIGKITIKSPHGNNVNVYNKERTICDCIIKKEHLDIDLVVTAIKQYMNLQNNDIPLLLNYAESFNIRKTIRQYIEVLT